MRSSEHEAVLDQVATAVAYVASAHDLLLTLQDDLDGRYSDSFAAAFELVEELNCELALLQRRAVCEKGH